MPNASACISRRRTPIPGARPRLALPRFSELCYKTGVSKTRLIVGALLTVVIAASLALLGWRAFARRPPERFVLIVIDSLRADHLGCYGSPKGLTPNIDALGARSVRFANTFAASSWTFPSNAALLTGRYPHEVRDRRALRLADEAKTIAEHLRAAGYATAGFSTHFMVSPHWNTAQGFDQFMLRDRADDQVLGACCRWMARHQGDKYFVLLYLWAPHWPYTPSRVSPELKRKFAHVRRAVRRGNVWMNDETRRPRITAHPRTNLEFSPLEIEVLHGLYDGAIRDADQRVGRVVKELGDDPRAVVAVLADHGEEWLDHGGLRHMHTLYRELLHVPFVLNAPGWSPRVMETPVSNVDVLPTFLSLAGLKTPPGLRGRALEPGNLEVRPVYSEVGYCMDFLVHRYAVRVSDRTAIYTLRDLPNEPAVPKGGVWEEYDLARDPGQHHVLAGAESDGRARELVRDYYKQTMATVGPRPVRVRKSLDAETARKMRALGYVTR